MALNFFKQRDIDEIDVNDIPEEFINYLETLDEAGKIGLLHIKGLAEGLQIGSVHRISVEQYYLDMLLQYDSAFKPENKIVSEMQVRQDYVDYIYSDQFKNDFERAYNDILEKRNGLVDILIQLQEAMNQEKKTISWTEESRFTIQMKYSVDALNDLLRKKEQDFASAQDKITKAEERRAFLEDRIPASEQFAKSIVQESLPRVNTIIVQIPKQ